MAGMYFIPSSCVYITIDTANNEHTHIRAPLKHDNNFSRCTVVKTGEFLDSIDGELYIISYSDSKEKTELKSEGYVGYLSYAKGYESEPGSYTVLIHVSGGEFKRITSILSNGNNLVKVDIETPLHDKNITIWNISR